MERRLQRQDLVALRRSAGTTGLPPGQVKLLLDELDALFDERAQVARLLRELGDPWRSVRSVLAELHALDLDGTASAERRRPRR